MKMRNKTTKELTDAELREDGIYLWNKYMNDWEKYSLDVLAKYYEYYVEPKEPLVEGRKQRAVLKAAARLSGATTATVRRWDRARIVIFDFAGKCRVELKDIGINIKNDGLYTITELCGEEKKKWAK